MNFYIFILLTCLIISVVESRSELYETDLTDDEIFDQFNEKFKVPFRRRVDFNEVKRTLGNRYRSVQEQNSRYINGLESFNRTLYPFSYMADEDFGEYFLGAEEPDPKTRAAHSINSTKDVRNGRNALLEPPETSFEWPESIKGPVKSQGSCGSCYAFAAIGVIKSRMAVKYGKMLYDLSEQDAMECTRGCKGGWEHVVYNDYSRARGGCAAYNYQKPHSYTGIAYGCQASSRPRVPNSKVTTFYYLQNNEKIIRQYLYNYGPLYTRFNVYSNFYDYQSGIYDRLSGSYLGGHAVILTGYGVENGKKYWILKNSWDSWWGERGYFRMLRGVNLGGIEATVSVVTDIQ